ncbi:MAG: hypothetical protein M1823_002252 [Watsoniomyces obsoletus]|nr:MAG: hypothetical protein M1823_002252 [Watsoniomyces obsoletus]
MASQAPQQRHRFVMVKESEPHFKNFDSEKGGSNELFLPRQRNPDLEPVIDAGRNHPAYGPIPSLVFPDQDPTVLGNEPESYPRSLRIQPPAPSSTPVQTPPTGLNPTERDPFGRTPGDRERFSSMQRPPPPAPGLERYTSRAFFGMNQVGQGTGYYDCQLDLWGVPEAAGQPSRGRTAPNRASGGPSTSQGPQTIGNPAERPGSSGTFASSTPYNQRSTESAPRPIPGSQFQQGSHQAATGSTGRLNGTSPVPGSHNSPASATQPYAQRPQPSTIQPTARTHFQPSQTDNELARAAAGLAALLSRPAVPQGATAPVEHNANVTTPPKTSQQGATALGINANTTTPPKLTHETPDQSDLGISGSWFQGMQRNPGAFAMKLFLTQAMDALALGPPGPSGRGIADPTTYLHDSRPQGSGGTSADPLSKMTESGAPAELGPQMSSSNAPPPQGPFGTVAGSGPESGALNTTSQVPQDKPGPYMLSATGNSPPTRQAEVGASTQESVEQPTSNTLTARPAQVQPTSQPRLTEEERWRILRESNPRAFPQHDGAQSTGLFRPVNQRQIGGGQPRPDVVPRTGLFQPVNPGQVGGGQPRTDGVLSTGSFQPVNQGQAEGGQSPAAGIAQLSARGRYQSPATEGLPLEVGEAVADAARIARQGAFGPVPQAQALGGQSPATGTTQSSPRGRYQSPATYGRPLMVPGEAVTEALLTARQATKTTDPRRTAASRTASFVRNVAQSPLTHYQRESLGVDPQLLEELRVENQRRRHLAHRQRRAAEMYAEEQRRVHGVEQDLRGEDIKEEYRQMRQMELDQRAQAAKGKRPEVLEQQKPQTKQPEQKKPPTHGESKQRASASAAPLSTIFEESSAGSSSSDLRSKGTRTVVTASPPITEVYTPTRAVHDEGKQEGQQHEETPTKEEQQQHKQSTTGTGGQQPDLPGQKEEHKEKEKEAQVLSKQPTVEDGSPSYAKSMFSPIDDTLARSMPGSFVSPIDED